jgi:hypothetical protein
MAATKERGETVSGYFRQVFKENPSLLDGRSNQELLDRWLKDHPGQKDVPKRVKANLQNIKSVLRKQARKRKGGRPKKAAAAVTNGAMVQAPAPAASQPTTNATRAELEQLEIAIDDCMSQTKYIDAEGLQDVIDLLRRARNRVVWKQGE